MATFRRFLNDGDRYVQSHIYALEAKTVNDLYSQYERSYLNLQIQLEAIARRYGTGETWSANDAAFRERTEVLVAQIMAEMRALSRQSSDTALQAAVDAYQASFYGRAWMVDTLTGGKATVPILPAEAVRAAILAPYEGSTFVDRFKTNEDEFQRRIRQAVVASQINGDTIYQAQKRIAGELGIDIGRRTQAAKAANQGNFFRTQMIARTEILRSSNQGSLAVYEANKDVLRGWEWITAHDDRVCPECGPMDGKFFEFGGGESPPPLHVNCLLPGTVVVTPERITAATKSFYVGPCVEIALADGRVLSVTENHPIATPGGWIKAGSLSPGDNVIGTIDCEGVLLSVHPNHKNRPAVIEEIVGALMKDGEMIARSVPVSPEDFHGDGRYTYGDIDIVRMDSLLLGDIQRSTQPVGQNIFSGGDMALSGLSSFGAQNSFVNGNDTIARGVMGSTQHTIRHFGGGVLPSDVHSVGDVAALDAVSLKEVFDCRPTNTEGLTNFLFTHAADICVQPVLGIRHFDFTGHVYNLEIDVYGLYISNGVITSNCRCSAAPAARDVELEAQIVGPRETFTDWATRKGIQGDRYGNVYALPPQKPPKSRRAA